MVYGYNSTISKTTKKSPFEVVYGYNPKRPFDLAHTSLHVYSDSAFTFATDFKNLHDNIKNQIELSNLKYSSSANKNKSTREFKVDDYVLIRIIP